MRGIVPAAVLIASCLTAAHAAFAGEPPLPDPVPAASREVSMIVQAGNDLAVDLYRETASREAGGNLFFSPLSVSSVLLMAAEGARGETAEEMGRVLRLPIGLRRFRAADRVPWNLAPPHAGLAELRAVLQGSDRAAEEPVRRRIAVLREELAAANRRVEDLEESRRYEDAVWASSDATKIADELNSLLVQVDQYELRIASALWGERTCPFMPEFVAVLETQHGTGGVFPVDFKGNPDAARHQINAWVEKQTGDRIRDLVPPGALDRLTRLVLANAVYFRGEWTEPFEASRTSPGPFSLADGATREVPLMRADPLESAGYAAFNGDGTFFDTPHEIPAEGPAPPVASAAGGFALLEMPYKGARLSMVVIAPNRPDGLAAIERRLSGKTIREWLSRLEKRNVNVLLPKFRLEYSCELGEPLRALGMKRAFRNPLEGNGAEFDGMIRPSEPADRVWIAAVLHKAFVDVNEKGTEAAAATALVMPAAGVEPIPFIPTFRADRPFLFLIRDVPTGAILFLGRLTEP